MGQRMPAGKLLHMMDLAAASAAAKHAETPLVTLSFDRIELTDFVCHMDYIRYEAYLVQVGRSSMVVRVDGYSKAPTEMEIRPGHSGVITMVAIDENRRPNRTIPALEYRTPEDLQKKAFAESRQRLLKNRKKMIDQIEQLEHIEDGKLQDYYPRKTVFKPTDTVLTIRKKFLPRNANALGVVFGGDTIEMMEELALATARQFTGNFRMVTIAMEDVLFLQPLLLDDLVEMSSMVTFVSNTTMVVEITVKAVDFFGRKPHRQTNKGTFTILNYDRSGRKKSILHGLDMADTDINIRRCYLKEKTKYDNRTRK